MTKNIEVNKHYDVNKESRALLFHTMFYGLYVAFLLAVVARNILNLNIPVLMLLILASGAAVFGDKNEIIALTISFLPMTSAFQYKYAILVCIVIYVMKFPKDVKIKGIYGVLFTMLGWELLHGAFYEFSAVELLRQFSEIIFCVFLASLAVKSFDIKLTVRLLEISTVVAGFVTLFLLLQENNFDFVRMFESSSRLGDIEEAAESYSMAFNSNRLGTICNMSMCGILLLFKRREQTVLDIVMLVCIAILGVFTLSRSFLVSAAFLLVLFILSSNGAMRKLRTIVLVSALVGVVMYILSSFMPEVIASFMLRFEVDDISNGRNDIFAVYMDHILSSFSNAFFGVGIQSLGAKMHAILGLEYRGVPHNAIQEVVVAWGVFGLVLVGAFMFCLIKESDKLCAKKTFANYIPLLILLFTVQFGQFLTSSTALLSLAFAYVAMASSLCNEKV